MDFREHLFIIVIALERDKNEHLGCKVVRTYSRPDTMIHEDSDYRLIFSSRQGPQALWS